MYYYPLSDLAIIPLSNGKVLFKSDNVAIRVDGQSSSVIVNEIFPLLNGENSLEEISNQVGISGSELEIILNQFVSSGILRYSNKKIVKEERDVSPLFDNFLDSLGLNLKEVNSYLIEKRIGIVGLDGLGFQLIEQLIQYGLCRFNIADTTTVEQADLKIYTFLNASNVGKIRQEVFRDILLKRHPSIEITIIENLSKDCLRTHLKDCDLLLGCFDKDYIVSNYWINDIGFELKIPSLYADIRGQRCFVGPLVIPDVTSCFMCYKMRSIACEENFEEAMSYEEFLNSNKKSSFNKRSFLPTNVGMISSLMTAEVIKFLLAFDLPSLKNRIMEFDTFNLRSEIHHILIKPNCPICQKKKQIRKHIDLNSLVLHNSFEGVLSLHEQTLVSKLTGVVKFYDLFKKDISEPNIPFIYRADLANHNFIPGLKFGDSVCSGKGLTLEKAKISALGEAVERYSGAVYDTSEISYESFNLLEGKKLHPDRLVLFEDHQYADLEYAKFHPDTKIGWSRAYSLSDEGLIWVPSISVFMDYKIKTDDEFLFAVTSNGLGAGATLLQAVLSAALEVIERDIFVISWHQKLTCLRYDPLTIPMPDIVNYCKMYLQRGVKLSLFQLPTDFPCYVFLAVAQQIEGAGPAIVVGLGADFDPHKAAAGALIEVGQVRPGLKKRMRLKETQDRLLEIMEDSNKVTELEDHDLLYASPSQTDKFNFLLNQPIKDFDLVKVELNEEEKITLLLKHLKDIDSALIYYDLTPIDMEKINIYTTRVIIPDLQPIHFGMNKIRLAGNRLYELPYRMGLKESVGNFSDINLQPHPLA